MTGVYGASGNTAMSSYDADSFLQPPISVCEFPCCPWQVSINLNSRQQQALDVPMVMYPLLRASEGTGLGFSLVELFFVA